MMLNAIKVVLAIFLLLCLAPMPYGYYQLVRFIAMLGFGILAYHSNKERDNAMAVVYAVLAVLFQPLFKIALGRELWNIVDVVVGVGLFVSLVINIVSRKKK